LQFTDGGADGTGKDKAFGLKCNGTVTVKRVVWYGYSPGNFLNEGMKIAQWDAAAKTTYDDKTKIAAMQVDNTKHSNVPFRNK
jgi:hypothetical protein